MSKLLYIKSSPTEERSHSVAVTNAFVDEYAKQNPHDGVVTLNLFKKELPAFDGLALKAKYTILHGLEHTNEELQAWQAVEHVIAEFKAADKYVFAVPMWNFGIPYRLKHYLDVIIQPGYTFSFSPTDGYKGLVTGKRVFAAYARGGEYKDGTAEAAYDYQKKYFELALNFMGLTDIRSVVVEPTLASGPEVAKSKQVAAIADARRLAREF
jgi:FMN-dependent NADH-azoreductase